MKKIKLSGACVAAMLTLLAACGSDDTANNGNGTGGSGGKDSGTGSTSDATTPTADTGTTKPTADTGVDTGIKTDEQCKAQARCTTCCQQSHVAERGVFNDKIGNCVCLNCPSCNGFSACFALNPTAPRGSACDVCVNGPPRVRPDGGIIVRDAATDGASDGAIADATADASGDGSVEAGLMSSSIEQVDAGDGGVIAVSDYCSTAMEADCRADPTCSPYLTCLDGCP